MKEYKKVMVCVGHYSKKQGARSVPLGISEWQINSILAAEIESLGWLHGFKVSRIADLNLIRKVKLINEGQYDICIDLHCNAAPVMAAGHEILYWHKSSEGKALAQCLTRSMTFNDPRRILPISGGNGAFFLNKTRPLAVIIESCFADCEEDFEVFAGNLHDIAEQIINGLLAFPISAHYVNLLHTKGT